MGKDIEYFENLIVRYLREEASRQEVEEMVEWLEQNEKNMELFFQLKSAWQETGSLKIHFDREKEWNKLYRRIMNKRISPYRNFWVRVIQIAAVFLIAFITGWIINAYYSKEPERSWLKVNVPTGQITHLSLSDGSEVWINSESTFKYPSDFSKNQRKVVLSGEAYFEVAENRKSPFVVVTECMDIRVLGTRFNISAYGEDQLFHVYLLEGKLALKNSNSKKIRTSLFAGDQAMFHKNKGNLEVRHMPEEGQRSIAWMEGRYEFYNEPLVQILNMASRWYDVEFEIKDQVLKNTRFSGVMKKQYSVDQLLKLIQKTEEVVIVRNNNKIMLKPKK